MSLLAHAKSELDRINFGAEDRAVMLHLLEAFTDQWDSGGAVSVVAPIFQRLLAFQPLSPLTGADDEWFDPIGDGEMLQNKRCASVFKEKDGSTYDIASDRRVPITFPYDPDTRAIPSPVITVTTNGT